MAICIFALYYVKMIVSKMAKGQGWLLSDVPHYEISRDIFKYRKEENRTWIYKTDCIHKVFIQGTVLGSLCNTIRHKLARNLMFLKSKIMTNLLEGDNPVCGKRKS